MDLLETVRNLEQELATTKLEVAKTLRAQRTELNLSLAKAGHKVGLTQGALLNIEQGKSWKTKTVAKIARVYEKLAAA